MSNSLTGDFDLVAQFSKAAADNVLGSVHQKGDGSDGEITFLHSFRTKISSQHETAEVRGRLDAQVSTPTIEFVPGSASRVIVCYRVRARFFSFLPDCSIPEIIHGMLKVTCTIIQHQLDDHNSLLSLKLQSDDADVTFTPATGLEMSDEELTLVTQEMRRFIKSHLEPTNVKLPGSLDHLRFKMMPPSAVALMLRLTNDALPIHGADSVTQIFLESGDSYAIAISDDYILNMLGDMKQAIKGIPPINRNIYGDIKFLGVTFVHKWLATIQSTAPTVKMEFTDGGIEVTITMTGELETSAWLLNLKRHYNWKIEIKEKIGLTLDVVKQKFKLHVAAETISITNLPSENGILAAAQAEVESLLHQYRDPALAQAQSDLNDALKSSFCPDQLLNSSLGLATQASYQSVEVRAAGLVLHCWLSTGAFDPVQVEVGMTDDEASFTALESWVPAGWVHHYQWRWQQPTNTYPFFTIGKHTARHRFMLPVPPGVTHEAGQVCLQVTGQRGSTTVVGEPDCWFDHWGVETPVGRPIWWDKLHIGVYGVLDPEAVTEVTGWGLVGHLDVGPGEAPSQRPGVPTVVHFAGAHTSTRLPEFIRAMQASCAKNSALSLVIVLPHGMLEHLDHQALAELRLLSANSQVALAFTEDYEGGWTGALGVRELPSTHLIKPGGEQTWHHHGALDIPHLLTALDQHLVPGSRLSRHPIRSKLSTGTVPPDFFFDLAAEQRVALHRLRGRRVVLNFWSSWSSPCLAELGRLQEQYGPTAEDGTMVLAINVGEDPKHAAEVLRQKGLNLRLIPDPDREIARKYGIRCWPTTIVVDKQGKITRRQLGISRKKLFPDTDTTA